jgi:CBS domain-containing protein
MDEDREIPTVTPDTSTDEALRLMLDAENFMLPVIDGGKVVGVVSRTDVVRLIERLESQGEEPAA